MSEAKKPIRRWGEPEPAAGTMRELRSLQSPAPDPTPAPQVSPPPAPTEPEIAPRDFHSPVILTTPKSTDPVDLSDPGWSLTNPVITTRPVDLTGLVNLTDPTSTAANISVTPVKGEQRIPNTIIDGLLPLLEPIEAVIYLRLYRLSHGYRKQTCQVGYEKLSKSVNASDKTVRRAVDRLEKLGLIQRLGASFGGASQGNHYFVRLPASTVRSTSPVEITSPVNNTDPVKSTSPVTVTDIKDDDDHDDLKANHHQSEPAVESQNIAGRGEKMMIVAETYHELTGNRWTEFDEKQYREIGHFDPEKVADAMRAINSRAGQPIGTFAYFVKGIKAELSPQRRQSRALLKQRYDRFAREIAANRVGAGAQRPSDVIEALKSRCLREGLQWNDDLANEVLGI